RLISEQLPRWNTRKPNKERDSVGMGRWKEVCRTLKGKSPLSDLSEHIIGLLPPTGRMVVVCRKDIRSMDKLLLKRLSEYYPETPSSRKVENILPFVEEIKSDKDSGHI